MRYDSEIKLYLDFDLLWNNDSDDLCFLLLLSSRDINIILNSIRYASYPSRWLDSSGNLLRDTDRLSDLAIALAYIEQLERRILGMACLEDLTNAIITNGEAIKAGLVAIANRPCCNDGVILDITQGTSPGGDIVYGTQPPLSPVTDPEGPPPEGFDSWEEFYAYKCKAAHWITDSLIATYRNLGVMQLATIFVGSVAIGAALAGLITFIPPAGILLLIAGLLGLGVSLSVVNAIGDWLSDHREDVICMLYGSDSTTAAIDGFWGLVQEALEELSIASDLVGWIKQITFALLSTDLLNTLFNDSLQANYPDADCSGCDDYQECVLLNFRDSQTNGFIDFPDAFDDLPTPSATRQIQPTVDGLRVTASAVSGQRVVIVDNANFNIPIQTGMTVVQYYTNNASVNTSIRVYLVTNAGLRVFYNTHGQGSFNHTNPLDAYEGETIERVVLTANSNGGNVDVTWESVEVTCP